MSKAKQISTTVSSEENYDESFVPELEAKIGQGLYNFWTAKDEAKLRRYYGKVPTKDLAAHLNRSISAVSAKASDLGLHLEGA